MSPHRQTPFPGVRTLTRLSAWEHVYYLNDENPRGDDLRAWWSIVNWKEAARCFDWPSDQAAARDWEDEGGMVQGVTT